MTLESVSVSPSAEVTSPVRLAMLISVIGSCGPLLKPLAL